MACTTLHTRIQNFVSWIRPDPDKAEEARAQRDEVRDRIRGRAESDGLIVRSTPGSGSFATATGLRRHMRDGAEHEGQDIDCPFVLSRKDEDGDVLGELLRRFERYARASYPGTPIVPTKSSVRLEFVATKRNIDLVPMLAVDGNDQEQILLRAGGERRRTSIQKHVEFVKTRTTKSQQLRGPVAFNDVVRLLKWWREYQVTRTGRIEEVPSFLILLLCAKAFDEDSVRPTWPETLQNWFDRIQSYASRRANVTFGEFATPRPEKIMHPWKVIDPLNGENNAVPSSWGNIQIDELCSWARAARDKVQQAIAHDLCGRTTDAVANMSDVFGPTFKSHSEA